jgi:two-component system, LytTR family, sensor kinase
VSDYLVFESIRFEDRLRLRLEISDEARQIQIPACCCKRSLKMPSSTELNEFPRGEALSIRAVLDGERLRIEAENTGNLNNSSPSSTQIGLANARERLRILYADRASLTLLASGQGKVTATVLLSVTL